MNVGVFAFGGAGARLLSAFDGQAGHSTPDVISYKYLFETSKSVLDRIECVDDEHKNLVGRQKYEGKGTKGVLGEVEEVMEGWEDGVADLARVREESDVDAFLLLGSVGGGTGAAGLRYASRGLSNAFPDTPLYIGTVLPSVYDAPIYKANAGYVIRKLSNASDCVIVADNQRYDAARPGDHPDAANEYDDHSDRLDKYDELFEAVNDDFTECLYRLFAADERNTPSELESVTATTSDIHDTLCTGGFATFKTVSDRITPRERASFMGALRRLMRGAIPGLSMPGGDSIVAQDAYYTERPTGTDGDDGRSDGLTEVRARLSTHPVDLIDVSLRDEAALMPINEHTERTLHFMTGDPAYIDVGDVMHLNEIVSEHVTAERSAARYTPIRGAGEIGILTVVSGFGVPKRIDEVIHEADRIVNGDSETSEGKQSQNSTPGKNRTMFDESNDELLT